MNLHEEFASVKAEASTVIEKAKSENRDLTGEEREANEKRFARLDSIKAMVADENRLAGAAIEQYSAAVKSQLAGGMTGEPTAKADAAIVREMYGRKAHVKAIEDYIRFGTVPQNREEFAITTSTGSGVLLPKDVAPIVTIRRIFNPIFAALAAYGLKPLLTQGTETISIPLFDDSAVDGALTSEGATSETTGPGDPSAANGDGGVAGIQLAAKLFDSGVVWNSNTQLSAITYDLLGYLNPMLDKRIDHKQSVAWCAQVGTNATAYVGSSPTGITYADLVGWTHALKPEYRADGCFVINDGLLQAIETLVDTLGRPLYRQSIADNVPDTLMGYPVFVTDQFATPAANAKSGMFASAEALKVRVVENKRLVRYANIPTHPDQVGLQEFVNADFGFIPQGVRTFKHAAS